MKYCYCFKIDSYKSNSYYLKIFSLIKQFFRYVMINNFFFSYNAYKRVYRVKNMRKRIWPKCPTLNLQLAKTSMAETSLLKHPGQNVSGQNVLHSHMSPAGAISVDRSIKFRQLVLFRSSILIFVLKKLFRCSVLGPKFIENQRF